MLRLTSLSLASKTTAGNAKNQSGRPRRKSKLFHAIPGTPVASIERIKDQRRRFGQDRYSRAPEYMPGRNVRMDPNSYTLYPTQKGIFTIATSRINPSYKWVDVNPDIQKTYRSNEMRAALESRGKASQAVRRNATYTAELDHFEEPEWRQRVARERKATERFVDPNLFARGIVPRLDPLDRYSYE